MWLYIIDPLYFYNLHNSLFNPYEPQGEVLIVQKDRIGSYYLTWIFSVRSGRIRPLRHSLKLFEGHLRIIKTKKTIKNSLVQHQAALNFFCYLV